jgi:hypothetical protein
MRLGLTWLTISVILALSAGGCGAPGELVIEQAPSDPPSQTTVPADGSYGLFIAGQSDPVIRLALKQGDKLGFAITESGTVGAMRIQLRCAVAGSRFLPVDFNTSYQWRRL